MPVKTFKAISMAEALQMVKAELGPDAMIISSKKEQRKGLLRFFTKPVFAVTATIDQAPRPTRNPYQESKEPEGSTRDMFKNSMLEPLVREIRDLRGRVDALTTAERTVADNGKMPAGQGPGSEIEKSARDDLSSLQGVKPEVRKITDHLRNAAAAGLRGKPAPVSPLLETEFIAEPLAAEDAVCRQMSPQMQGILYELRTAGIGEELCGTLMKSLQQSAGEADGKEKLRSGIKTILAAMIRCAGQPRLKKRGPKLIALVGPTGVGKTTTIAKLAALYTLKKKAKVALVTTDNFRAGAVEQLKTYAKVLRLPMEVAATSKELAKVLGNHADKDLILIDTTGKSPLERDKLDGLKSLLAGLEIECHLCVAATTRDSELENIIDQFSALPVHRLLFTKLDESRQLGCMVNLQMRGKLPLSYFTLGQRVPEDIEVATGKKVAELVLGG
jgi:flagellar biosynthesis protein FlhF